MQAVSSLLHNSVKNTPMHSHVRIAVFAEGNNLVIKINDDHSGISPVPLPRICEHFAQSSRTIAAIAGGIGIGLAVANAIARSHNGTAAASSRPGEGSDFALRLPILKSGRAFYGSV